MQAYFQMINWCQLVELTLGNSHVHPTASWSADYSARSLLENLKHLQEHIHGMSQRFLLENLKHLLQRLRPKKLPWATWRTCTCYNAYVPKVSSEKLEALATTPMPP